MKDRKNNIKKNENVLLNIKGNNIIPQKNKTNLSNKKEDKTKKHQSQPEKNKLIKQNDEKTIPNNINFNIKNIQNSETIKIEKTIILNKNDNDYTIPVNQLKNFEENKSEITIPNQNLNNFKILENTSINKINEISQTTLQISKDDRTQSLKQKIGLASQIDLKTTKSNSSSNYFEISESINLNKSNEFKWEVDDVLLGTGTFGNVYKITDEKKNSYALKIIEFKNDEDFEFEYNQSLYEVFIMKQLNKLNSPFILKFIDCLKNKTNENTQIMIMLELCECSLQDIIEIRRENKSYWTEEELLYYFYNILNTLFQFFELKISHRDIKPRNLLYQSNDKKLKLADFGEAKLLTNEKINLNDSISLSELNTVRGTPNFMSPEIFLPFLENKYVCKYNPFCSDIYSLGITFLSMKLLRDNIKRNEIDKICKEDLNENCLSNIIIKNMLDNDFVNRFDKTVENLKNCIEKNKEKYLIPCNETKIIEIFNLKKMKNLSPDENFKKQMMIAALYKKLFNFNKAIDITKSILGNISSYYKENDLKFIFFQYKNLLNLGKLYLNMKNYKESIIQYELAYEILTKIANKLIDKETYSDEYGNLLNELGQVYKNDKNIDKALSFYKKSLELAIKENGQESKNVSVIYNNLGNIFMEINRKDEAKVYLEKSLQILKKLKNSDPKDLIITLENLSSLYSETGFFKQALSFCQEALKLNISKYGEFHPEISRTLANLGVIFLKQNDYKSALENFEKCLNIKKHFFGIDSLQLIVILNNIGLTYNTLNDDEKAKQSFIDCLKICEINNENDELLANTYFNYANLLSKINEFDSAKKYYNYSLEFYFKNNKDFEKIALCHYNLGVIAIKNKDKNQDKNQVTDEFKKSIENYEKYLKPDEIKKNKNITKMKEYLKK